MARRPSSAGMERLPRPGQNYALAANVAMAVALILVLLTFIFNFGALVRTELVINLPGEGGRSVTAKEWVKAHPVPEDVNILPTELTRTARSSVSVVQVRDAEALHVHARHDLSVTLLYGSGELALGGERLKLFPGRQVFIPAGTPHAFTNKGKRPAAAMVVSAPPYDPRDIKEVKK